MGSITVRIRTKLMIIVSVLAILVGLNVFIWMKGNKQSESSVSKKEDVRVETQAGMKELSKASKAKRENEITFDQFNELLDELLSQTDQKVEGSGEMKLGTNPEGEVPDMALSEAEASSPKEERDKREDIDGSGDGLGELIQKILDVAARHQTLLEEYRTVIATPSMPGRGELMEELYWKLSDLEFLKAAPLFMDYLLRTRDVAAFEPGGWIDSLGVLKVQKIEWNDEGVPTVHWLPGMYFHQNP